MDQTFLNQAYQNPAPNLLADVCEKAATMDSVIDLSIGDPDLPTPVAITEAAFKAVKAGDSHYTAAMGKPELRVAIAAFYTQRFNRPTQADQVMVTVGAEHALFLVLQALLNPGEEVIVLEPSFSPYVAQVKLAQGVPVEVATDATKGFALDITALKQAVTPKTKAIVINSPNNPTGNVLTVAEAKALAEVAIENNLMILSDEIYADYVEPGVEFVSLATYAPANTVIVSGFSKNFAMTGWRIGYVVGPDWLVEAVGRVNDSVTFSAPTPSQDAALFALAHYDELTKPVVNEFKNRLAYLNQALAKVSWLKLTPSMGSIYLFPSIQATGMDSLSFADKLLNEAGILVVPGVAFGQSGEGFVRIAATQKQAVLEEAVKRMKKLEW